MWRPASKGTQMEERVTEDGEKQRRWKRDGNDDDEDEGEAGNVDSGFLSGGNLQFSGEISGDSGLLHSPPEEGPRTGPGEGARQEGRAASGRLAPEATTPTPSSAAIADEEPMRAIDSGVDLDLTETLSQLSLKQVSLNPLAAKGKLIQAEPTTPELLPVNLARHDERTAPEGRRDHDEKCATSGEEQPWQLYYTQDDDGDT